MVQPLDRFEKVAIVLIILLAIFVFYKLIKDPSLGSNQVGGQSAVKPL